MASALRISITQALRRDQSSARADTQKRAAGGSQEQPRSLQRGGDASEQQQAACGYATAQQQTTAACTLCRCRCKCTGTSLCLSGFSDNRKNRMQRKGSDTELPSSTACATTAGPQLLRSCARLAPRRGSLQPDLWMPQVGFSHASLLWCTHCLAAARNGRNSSPRAALLEQHKRFPTRLRSEAARGRQPTQTLGLKPHAPSPPGLPLHASSAFRCSYQPSSKLLFRHHPGF